MASIKALAVCAQVPGLQGMRGLPAHLMGEPGVGKSRTIESISQRIYNQDAETVIVPIQDPTDLGGLPIPNQSTGKGEQVGYTKQAPAWAVRLSQNPGFLFFDELGRGAPSQQNATMRVILDRWVGELKLHKYTAVMAASNPADITVGGFEMDPALANRLVHLDWEEPDADRWANGLMYGWDKTGYDEIKPIPTGTWNPNYIKARALVTTYLTRQARGQLHQFPKNQAEWGKAWPSPRTWEMATRAIGGVFAIYGNDIALMHEVVAGCVGMGAATGVMQYIEKTDLPDPEEVLAHAENFKVDRNRPDRTLVIFSNAVATAIRSKDKRKLQAAALISLKCAEQGQQDVGATGAKPLVNFVDTPDFKDLMDTDVYRRLGTTYFVILKDVKTSK